MSNTPISFFREGSRTVSAGASQKALLLGIAMLWPGAPIVVAREDCPGSGAPVDVPGKPPKAEAPGPGAPPGSRKELTEPELIEPELIEPHSVEPVEARVLPVDPFLQAEAAAGNEAGDEGREGGSNILEIFVEKHFPEAFAQLEALKDEDPDLYFEELGHFGGILHEYAELAGRHPMLGEVFLRIRRCRMDGERIALVLMETRDGEQKAELERELRRKIEQLLELEREEAQLQIQRLRDELHAARRALRQQQEMKEEMVGVRMKQLLADLQGEGEGEGSPNDLEQPPGVEEPEGLAEPEGDGRPSVIAVDRKGVKVDD